MKPLFIPLMTKYFMQFKHGEKNTEFRKYGRGYTEKTCTIGRPVILSKGYSGERLHGKIISFEVKAMYHEVYGDTQMTSCIGIALDKKQSVNKQRAFVFA